MTEKSIAEQIVDEFVENVAKTEVIDQNRLGKLKIVLNSDRPKKADILEAIKEEDEDENP
jgi:hypothetical protein